jgi:hypothetical protein
MTGSTSYPRLLPLLTCRRPFQPNDVPLALPRLASAACARSICHGNGYPRDIQRWTPLPCHHDPGRYRIRGTQTRGKKTKSSFKLDDLPQGLVKPDPEPLPDIQNDALPAYPTVVLQARRNMLKFENCVLLTRVGGFYELYFEHAEEYGPLLNLKVARKKTNAGPVPMVP